MSKFKFKSKSKVNQMHDEFDMMIHPSAINCKIELRITLVIMKKNKKIKK